jgi:hypothetical protein
VEREVKVLCDGKEIPMVPFVEKLIGDVAAAIVGSLKGAEGAKEITIAVKSAGEP